eukprot:7535087-Alexandrium_andersonii.AAC.1
MSASLVGSEMCIRDRASNGEKRRATASNGEQRRATTSNGEQRRAATSNGCLLYTSDAADDM